MAEHLVVEGQTKAERYASLLPQIKALIEGESNLVANLANISAALHEAFGFWWVGFYLVEGDELVLGPFQGPVACTRIGRGRGVCGTAWQRGQTIVVEDVELFPGHIACSSASRSEIVVPMWKEGKVWGVLDIDSEKLATFDECDQEWLEKLCQMI
ncbi:MAG: GAF domain-containing protein [Tidjanibacter sp.]|jgi:GAF domain-containing protein|nr:GAF domain-containing protein [Tidjanibacter sp.]MBQ5930835.1 GAF domain-containing protein [Tidjanibacter sp.]